MSTRQNSENHLTALSKDIKKNKALNHVGYKSDNQFRIKKDYDYITE